MKLLNTIALLVISATIAQAQPKFKFKRLFLERTNRTTRAIMNYENYELNRLNVKAKKLDGKYIYLLRKEYKNGELTTIDTLDTYNRNRKNRTRLTFETFCQTTDDTLVKVQFDIGKYIISYNMDKIESTRYSMRTITNRSQIKSRLHPNTYPIFAYTLPFQHPDWPGYMFYCAIQGQEQPVENWGTELNIEHYWTFELMVEE